MSSEIYHYDSMSVFAVYLRAIVGDIFIHVSDLKVAKFMSTPNDPAMQNPTWNAVTSLGK